MSRKPTPDIPASLPASSLSPLPVVDRGPCPSCRSLGSIRAETVIKGGHAMRVFSCVVCECSWHLAEA